MKKGYVSLLIVALLVSIFICFSFAEDQEEEQIYIHENFEYIILDDNTISIVKYIGPNDVDVKIPSTIDGKEVSTLQSGVFDGHYNNTWSTCRLSSVLIPSTIVKMEGNPFKSSEITKYSLATDNSTFQLRNDAIYDMREMRLVHVSELTKEKNFSVMEGTKIIGDYAFYGTKIEGIIIPDSVEELGRNAISYTSCKRIIIPDTVVVIGESAFSGSEMTEIRLPKNIKEIEAYAFYHCTNLQEIDIPEGVTRIGENAFEECFDLKTVSIPDSLEEIDGNPFTYCRSLDTFLIAQDHSAFAVIDGVLFGKRDKRLVFYPSVSSKGKYSIPKGINIIGEWAFYMAEPSEIIIPDTVNTIEEYAFYACGNLERIVVPEGVTSISSHAFDFCSNLSTVELPVSLRYIADYAFSRDKSIKSIILPRSLEGIGNYAFSETYFKEINLPDSLQYIGYGAFAESGINSITIPKAVSDIGGNPFICCKNLGTVKLDRDNEYFSFENGVLYSADKKRLIYYPIDQNATEFTISDGVNEIAYGAFSYASKLISIIIPDSVEIIGDHAFEYSGVGSVQMSQNLRIVGSYAFGYCNYLEELELPDTVVEIGYYAFRDWSRTYRITVSKGSYAADYCSKNGIEYIYRSSTDWLGEYEPEETPSDGSPTPRPTTDWSHFRLYSVEDCYDVAVEYIKSTLKNPVSLQIHSYSVVDGEDEYTFVFDYSAQNGFGGYNRTNYYVMVSHKSCQVTFAWSK